jgi:hypothetical protein
MAKAAAAIVSMAWGRLAVSAESVNAQYAQRAILPTNSELKLKDSAITFLGLEVAPPVRRHIENNRRPSFSPVSVVRACHSLGFAAARSHGRDRQASLVSHSRVGRFSIEGGPHL